MVSIVFSSATSSKPYRLVQRAERAGYQVLIVTVDAPLAGIRNREQRMGFQLPKPCASCKSHTVSAERRVIIKVKVLSLIN
jgi:isopentenyl diphosphate isomerase/L-lactate dehydrogenase-like FMN-dependent dehydrogenase